MPQPLTLDLPEELLEQLMRQAERSQRSLPELIEHLLAQGCREIASDT
ncbi:ribbon-helix-helix domain-containing protein [Vulcanococcus sp.]